MQRGGWLQQADNPARPAPQGEPMAPACREADLEGFPTWVIGDQRLVGEQSFDALEAALAAARAAGSGK